MRTGRLKRTQVRLDDLRALVERPAETYRFADRVADGVPIFESDELRVLLGDGRDPVAADVHSVGEVLTEILAHGPGIFVLAGAVDHRVVDRATAVFDDMIARQHAEGRSVGDHYARPGANDRVWNAIEKLAVADPGVFVDYYANDMVALGALAWLGPRYQISSQVNVVNPGGDAQRPHRDYHLGFMTDDDAESYPAHAHLLSPMLTLQGAVAHCDMPVASGPTRYLPSSQRYPLGYLAWRNPEIIGYFEQHCTQLPLAKGDLVYFNPALLHAAGANTTGDVRRMANLLQISSAMGRAMETIDRPRMSVAVYAALLARRDRLAETEIRHVATAVADGYAFPTNLDKDPPIGGLTPRSHLDILLDSLAEGVDTATFAARVDAMVERRRSV